MKEGLRVIRLGIQALRPAISNGNSGLDYFGIPQKLIDLTAYLERMLEPYTADEKRDVALADVLADLGLQGKQE